MDERLVSMYRRFTWRILSNYVTPRPMVADWLAETLCLSRLRAPRPPPL